MTRQGRMRRIIPIALTVLVTSGLGTSVLAARLTSDSASGPTRSGRIVGGMGFRPPEDCASLPDCAVWLESGCDPALSGRDPAWLTSIVDVGALAGGRRVFDLRPWTPVGNVAGGVVIQFWRRDCTEITYAPSPISLRTQLEVPSGATWMTVAANDNENIEWTLK